MRLWDCFHSAIRNLLRHPAQAGMAVYNFFFLPQSSPLLPQPGENHSSIPTIRTSGKTELFGLVSQFLEGTASSSR